MALDPRRWPRREVIGLGIVTVLVASAIATGAEVDNLRETFTERVDTVQHEAAEARTEARTNAEAVEHVETLLADVCGTVPDQQLEDEGLDRECHLAEAGNIEEQVPVAQPREDTPVRPGVTLDTVQGVVDSYLRRYLTDLPAAYRDDLAQTVTQYLADRRGPQGLRGPRGRPGAPPTDREVAAAVAGYLQANPPPSGEPGEPGQPGVSVTSAFLDGCDVVFTYSDGDTSRVGPICGPPGPQGEQGPPGRPPTEAEVQAAVDTYCANRPDGDCVGPQGETGPQGPQGERGPAGRGIARIECESATGADITLRVFYDDGTSDEVRCTSAPEPSPTPSPETGGP